MHDVTGLLLSWRQGDAAALDRLVPLVYDELRRVASRRLQGESPGHALQATALVHEVYLRLVDVDRMTLTSRAHFFGVAATLMRQILVDHARRQRADKRGGGVTLLSLDEVSPAAWRPAWTCSRSTRRSMGCPRSTPDSAASWNSILRGAQDRRSGRSAGISPATVEREWALARAWLFRRLSAISDRSSRGTGDLMVQIKLVAWARTVITDSAFRCRRMTSGTRCRMLPETLTQVRSTA